MSQQPSFFKLCGQEMADWIGICENFFIQASEMLHRVLEIKCLAEIKLSLYVYTFFHTHIRVHVASNFCN